MKEQQCFPPIRQMYIKWEVLIAGFENDAVFWDRKPRNVRGSRILWTSAQFYYAPWYHIEEKKILILYTSCASNKNHVPWHDGVSLPQKQSVQSSLSSKRSIIWKNNSASFNISEWLNKNKWNGLFLIGSIPFCCINIII